MSSLPPSRRSVLPATIDAVDAANQRLTVLMTLVGQETPVDLSFGQVKKAD